jgi:hypothetical protein
MTVVDDVAHHLLRFLLDHSRIVCGPRESLPGLGGTATPEDQNRMIDLAAS